MNIEDERIIEIIKREPFIKLELELELELELDAHKIISEYQFVASRSPLKSYQKNNRTGA